MKLSLRSPLIAIALLTLLGIASLYGVYKRNQAETINRAVSIAVEMDVVQSLAAGQGITEAAALQRLKASGVNALVLSEETIGELASLGQINFRSISVPSAVGEPPVPVYTIELADPAAFPRIQHGLSIRFGPLVKNLTPRDGRIALPDIDMGLIRSVSIGIDPEHARLARDNGFTIIGRVANTPGLSAQAVRDTVDWLADTGARVYLPQGDQVLGRRDSTDDMIDELRAKGMYYASAEFGKIGGDSVVLARAPESVVRLHTAQAAEMDKLTREGAIDRFGKAARERNNRILLLRPLTASAPQPLDAFAALAKDISLEVSNRGLILAEAHQFADPVLPRTYRILMGILAGGFAFAFGALFVHPRNGLIGLGIVGFTMAALGATGKGPMLNALAVSILAPMFGFYVVDRLRPSGALPSGFRAVIAGTLASLCSLIGGLYVAATMTGITYMVKAEEFSGVKIAVFVPIAVVGLAFLVRYTDWRGTLKSSITWGTAALGIVLVAVIAILMARTGNDGGVGASGMELMFRNQLDNMLFVRPRTKEFLIGNPLLIVMIGMLYRYTGVRSGDHRHGDPRFGGWIAMMAAMGAVGQTGIVNTLCHGHIPVMLSIARIGLGWLIGGIIGIGLWAIVKRILPPAQIDLEYVN